MGEVVILHTLCKLLPNSVDDEDQAIRDRESAIGIYDPGLKIGK